MNHVEDARLGGILRPGKAIPTEFRGITFRSRLEANVARFIADLGIDYEYESKSFLVGRQHFCPDFFLPATGQFIEVRGYQTETSEQTLWDFSRSHCRYEGSSIVCPGLIVFRSEGVERLDPLADFLLSVDVLICASAHASLGTLAAGKCSYCHEPGSAYLEIDVRSGVPVLISEVGRVSR